MGAAPARWTAGRLLLLLMLLLPLLLLLLLPPGAAAGAATAGGAAADDGNGDASGSGSSIQLMLDSFKEIASCPGSFLKCMLSSPCRETMACAGHCVHGPTMNLTCFVPCTFGRDQHAFNSFTDCVMRAKPDPDDPGVESLPAQGQCLDVTRDVVTGFDPSRLEGEWYVAAGASSLEAYDCQKNRVTRRNATHWQIDEYYQGYIEGLGFKWAQSRQVFHPLGPAHPGQTAWRPADGASGYEAVYHTLASHEDWHIFYYCAPLRPTPLYWSSFLLYSRSAAPPKKAMKEIQGLLDRYKWPTPLIRVNHENCTYRIANPDSLHTPLPQPQPEPTPASSSSWWHRLLPFHNAPSIHPPFTPPTPSSAPVPPPPSSSSAFPSPFHFSLSAILSNLWGRVVFPPGQRNAPPIVVGPEGEGRDEMGEL